MAIGYACMTLGMRDAQIKNCLLKNADEDKLKELIEINLQALEHMIDYNIKNGIRLFRISSDIIPFGSHPVNRILWWEEYRDRLEGIGDKIKHGPVRVSMHPGQYSVLNSPHTQVVENAMEDLKYHNRFLDSLGVDISCKIILHVGGIYGNKKEALTRFKEHYASLDVNIKNRLVIENDDRCYSIEDVLDIGHEIGIPVIFDNLHHLVNPPMKKLQDIEWIKKCSCTWKHTDGKQKIHYSQQAEAGKAGAHSNTVRLNPFLAFYRQLESIDLDVMLETKDKNISALKCIYTTVPQIPKKYLEREWGRYKYLVMSKSGSIYKKITQLFKDESNTQILSHLFYNLIEEAVNMPYTKGAEENAALHIWGYFKKLASEKEKNAFNKRFDRYKNDDLQVILLKKTLWKLAIKYKITYLTDGYYFVGIDR